MTAKKAIALVCSARKRGNCYELADYTLNRLREEGKVITELINFYDYDIQPCHGCNYECLFQREKGCPIKDDVRSIWEKTWAADALLYFIPTYGGFPPALWFAFCQRYQGIIIHAPVERLKEGVLSILTLSSVKGSPGGGFTEVILRQYALADPRRLVCFESINTDPFSLKYRLIEDEGIRQRLRWLADRTLEGIGIIRKR